MLGFYWRFHLPAGYYKNGWEDGVGGGLESSFLLGRDACTNHGRCRLCFRLLARARGCRARVIVTSSLPVPYIPNFAMIVECKRTAYQLGRHGGGGRQRDHDLRARAAFMLGGSGVRKERCSGCLGERAGTWLPTACVTEVGCYGDRQAGQFQSLVSLSTCSPSPPRSRDVAASSHPFLVAFQASLPSNSACSALATCQPCELRPKGDVIGLIEAPFSTPTPRDRERADPAASFARATNFARTRPDPPPVRSTIFARQSPSLPSSVVPTLFHQAAS